MIFKYINNLFILLIYFFLTACSNFEKLKNDNKDLIENKSNLINYEKNNYILKENINFNDLNKIDFFSDTIDKNYKLSINDKNRIIKKLFKDKNYLKNPIKIFLLDDKIFGIDDKANFNSYSLSDGKIISSIKLLDDNELNIPTSLSLFNDHFIIGFKSGIVIKIDKEGKIKWKFNDDNLLSTPIIIFNDSLFVINNDNVISLDPLNGNIKWRNQKNGSRILQSKGGQLKKIANFVYYLLPNNSYGIYDITLSEEHLSNFNNISFVNSVNNSNDTIYTFENYIVYLDEGMFLYTYDIFSNKFTLNKFNLPPSNSFYFFNNSLFQINENSLLASNIVNGKIFFDIEINKNIINKTKISNIKIFQNLIYIFLNNGKIIVIEDNQVKEILDLKIKNINHIYFQNNKILISFGKNKTAIF